VARQVHSKGSFIDYLVVISSFKWTFYTLRQGERYFSLTFVDGVVLIEPDYVKDGKKGKWCFKYSVILPSFCAG